MRRNQQIILLCITLTLALTMWNYPTESRAKNTPQSIIVHNNLGQKQYILFGYKPNLLKRTAYIKSVEPGENVIFYCPPEISDAYIQFLNKSQEQYKITTGRMYDLQSINKEPLRKPRYTVKEWGTLFLSNDTYTEKTVKFRYSNCRYYIILKHDECIPIPYSKHLLDTTIGFKTLHVMGSKAKNMVVHDRDNYSITELLLNDKGLLF